MARGAAAEDTLGYELDPRVAELVMGRSAEERATAELGIVIVRQPTGQPASAGQLLYLARTMPPDRAAPGCRRDTWVPHPHWYQYNVRCRHATCTARQLQCAR